MTTVETRAPTMFDVVGGGTAPGLGGYYADDLLAVQAGAESDGLVYRGSPRRTGHRHIRNPAQAVLIRLRSSDGHVGWGDAVTVQYSGFAGREPPINPAELAPQLDAAVEALSRSGNVSFAEACELIEGLRVDGRRLHSGVRYGLSQALLSLAAAVSKRPQRRFCSSF